MGDPIQRRTGLTNAISGIFTTGQVAKMLGVAPRTVSKWDALKIIECFRLPHTGRGRNRQGREYGEGKDRRFTKDAIIKFCKEQSIPIPQELARTVKLASFGVNIIDNGGFTFPQLTNYTDLFDFGQFIGSNPLLGVCLLGTNRGIEVTTKLFDRIKQLHSDPMVVVASESGDVIPKFHNGYAMVELPSGDLTNIIQMGMIDYKTPTIRVQSYHSAVNRKVKKYEPRSSTPDPAQMG